MDCKKCTELPESKFNNSNICLTVPTVHHIEPIKNYLAANSTIYDFEDATFHFKSENFSGFIRDLENMNLSEIEQKDIKILPYPKSEDFSFGHLRLNHSLMYWSDLLKANEYLDILAGEKIQVLFQPIVDIKSGEIYGYEGLSRGILKNNELMQPMEMFDHARKTDTLFFLDRLCREKVINEAAKAGISEKIFINFVPTAIYDPDKCLKSTDLALQKNHLSPKQIVFEVVETEYIEDFVHLNRILNYYRDKGYKTAMDDMGSGYATPEALLKLKPDYLKIDLDIIRSIHLDAAKKQKLSHYLQLAKQYNIKTLAEGIENKQEFDYIKSCGVDLAQGFFLGRPAKKPVSQNPE